MHRKLSISSGARGEEPNRPGVEAETGWLCESREGDRNRAARYPDCPCTPGLGATMRHIGATRGTQPKGLQSGGLAPFGSV
jgi:hypothetical protein